MPVPQMFCRSIKHCFRTVGEVIVERKIRPKRADDSTRWVMATLSRFFEWRGALVNVQPDTLIRWHRKGFRLFWRWKSRSTGRPRLPRNIRDLIWQMAVENRTWGEEQIANELKLKLGIRISPRTVGKYLKDGGPRRAPDLKQRWLVFLRNHAKAVVACDFFVVVTATFRTLYVFVILELASRRIIHHNVTAHPTVEWTLQQFREALAEDHPCRFVIHDRDRIFSQELDKQVAAMGVRVLRTPVRAPQANAVCERIGGSLRRKCLDYLIPFHERHLQSVLTLWIANYGHGRPHMSLGPGIPAPVNSPAPTTADRHSIPAGHIVRSRPILGGLHHEYRLEPAA